MGGGEKSGVKLLSPSSVVPLADAPIFSIPRAEVCVRVCTYMYVSTYVCVCVYVHEYMYVCACISIMLVTGA